MTLYGRLAKVLYDSYLQFSEGKSLVTGKPLPTWDQLDDASLRRWNAVAATAYRRLARRMPAPCECDERPGRMRG